MIRALFHTVGSALEKDSSQSKAGMEARKGCWMCLSSCSGFWEHPEKKGCQSIGFLGQVVFVQRGIDCMLFLATLVVISKCLYEL